MEVDIDRIDISILYKLYEEDIMSPLCSWQIKDFINKTKINLSYNTILRRVTKLCDKEFLLYGYKEKKANTYYLSPKGTNFIINEIIEKEPKNNIEEEFVDET